MASTEEIWVIQRISAASEPGRDAPGSGTLSASIAAPGGEEKEVPLPLKKTHVRASILGYISTVGVEQRFHNPYDGTIEAVYTFPLPENAAVNEFVMTIGTRNIRGIIREKEEAQRVYAEAKRAGHTASLFTQERPNVFTQRVANIQPGHDIDVSITYYNTLTYSDGWYSFVFPMVVGPRFNPPGTTDGVGAVGRGQYGISGQETEVEYLRPGERSGHEIDLKVAIDAGVEIEEVVCPTHVVKTERPRGSKAVVRLAESDRVPNKDFVLSWRIAGDALKSALLTHKDERGGYFTLMIVPPLKAEKIERSPMEMVFVVDRSGSMNGKPIEQAREAVERGLRRLETGDSFQVIDFADNASQLGSRPLELTVESLRAGLRYVKGLDSKGGTMMLNGLRTALDFPHDEERLRFVAFLTDGFIGNERDILSALDERLGDSRVFSFGVGSSPNRFLMDEMAVLGRGAAAYVGLNDPAGEVMDLFFDRVSRPALRDVEIEWSEGAQVEEVYPARLPDVFVGRPLIVTGRFRGEFEAPITVRGRRGGSPEWFTVKAEDGGGEGLGRHALPSVWARTKIADLARREVREGRSYENQTTRVALDYNLMSAYTAFVAVDSLTRTDDRVGTTVSVGVPVPEGVKYETTVRDR